MSGDNPMTFAFRSMPGLGTAASSWQDHGLLPGVSARRANVSQRVCSAPDML
ncbi:hypothetical protein [Nocardia vermiculata]|uniref:Uncharacterized protein n=1 Tax=Nocardia vermiculata TaxID=257274 RepID=A0A846Y8I5_9NOCA|nr:hypothetical protein [Nocardia vermiculata]NKY54160.1 hypothetical protein [Nocardia vermiculata]